MSASSSIQVPVTGEAQQLRCSSRLCQSWWVDMPLEPMEESQLQIIYTHAGNRVVTCIAVLSPTNKTSGSGQESYKSKRAELLCAGASFIEIDLIRGGDYSLFADPKRLEPDRPGFYNVCVTRAHAYGVRSEVYPIGLWEPLPVIRTPLREKDEDVLLNLQAVLDDAYERGAYEDLDYSQALTPPLSPQD
jgi:hypothetical protein